MAIASTTSRAQQQMAASERVPVRVYAIDKRVAEMPADEDFSKPERAYATIHRRLVMGNSDWRPMSVERLGPVLPRTVSTGTPLGERAARGYLDARIVEVRLVSESIAYIIAQWPTSGSYDVRCMEIEGGKWLNAGNQQANTLDAARRLVEDVADTRRDNALTRQRSLYPQDHLNRFIDFLKKSPQEPKEFLLKNLASHRLTMYGQIAGRPAYSQLLCQLVGDPRFARSVGVIFMQMPTNLQAKMDQFVTADTPNPAAALALLHDVGWMGQPDQGVFDLLMAVGTANKSLPKELRVRIVLVDQQRPWEMIKDPADLRPYDVVPESYMANNVLRHFVMNPGETRNAFFILNFAQATKNLRWRADDAPIRSVGWRIADVLGDQCFAVMEHVPQISERGSISGRAARGLFDSAFLTTQYKPVAVALANSPFGTEQFDAATDLDSAGFYQDAFDGLINLGKLEDEHSASLIEGFFTEDFLKEIDRRHKLVFGRSLADEIGFDDVDLERFQRWIGRNWGRPREWRDHLGSLDAWRIAADEQPAP